MTPHGRARPFRITDRDETMLRYVVRFRFLSPTQLVRVVAGSPRGVTNRLRLLAAHRYLIRRRHTPTEPFIYGIANRGARFLATRGFDINHRLDWTGENRRRKNSPEHLLEIAEAMFHVDRAVRQHAIDLTDHHEILRDMPQPTQATKRPFLLRVPFHHRHNLIRIPIVPDRLFALHYPDARHNFALERDLGSMDVSANRLVNKPSIRRKQLGYYLAFKQRRIIDRWGFESFRVLFVTQSEARIESMLREQRRVVPQCPPGFFLYTTMQRLSLHGALGPAWRTTRRDHVSLLHTPRHRPAELARAIFS
jgi:hypothetical protein